MKLKKRIEAGGQLNYYRFKMIFFKENSFKISKIIDYFTFPETVFLAEYKRQNKNFFFEN